MKLQPTEYIFATGELYYYPHLKVTVKTAEQSGSTSLLRGLPANRSEVQSGIDNPELAASYNTLARGLGETYDMLILTTPEFAASFQPLKDYHDSTGMLTEIHTTTAVGSTDPDDVRDYIRERYLNDGITYVLIDGDDNVIPARDMYATVSTYEETDMPVDLYFGCLDGTLNYDGDGYWGEQTDGENGGDVDLIAEVYVGRASVGNTTEAERFVQKTLTYLANRETYLDNVLLCGEFLWDGIVEYGGDYMDELVGTCNRHGYTTVGMPMLFSINRLYDRLWAGNDWPAYELYNRISGGPLQSVPLTEISPLHYEATLPGILCEEVLHSTSVPSRRHRVSDTIRIPPNRCHRS